MSRKLSWNKTLDVKDNTGVKKVVRDLIGRSQPTNKIKQDINIIETEQIVDIQAINDNNSSINSIDNLLTNSIDNQLANQSNNLSNISLEDNIANSISNTPEIQSVYKTISEPEQVIDNTSSNLVPIQTQNIDKVTTPNITDNQQNLPNSTLIVEEETREEKTEPLANNPIRKTKKLLAKTVKNKETSKREIFSLLAMAQWHSESEQKVYEVMYQETIAHRRKERYFTAQGLCQKTGIASQTTVRVAIDGLVEKKSIEIVTRKGGGRLAIRYKIYSPSEIIVHRRQIKMKIDEQSKKIL